MLASINYGNVNDQSILILGARAPIALELARSFHHGGCKVILADSLCFPVSRWTNTIVSYEHLPNVRQDADSYIKAISTLIKTHSINHLIPTCEEAFYIAQFQQHWHCKVWTSNIELMDALHNKETFATNFNAMLPIPETISADQFSDWVHSRDYVFKPKYSRFGSQTIINKTITADTLKEPEKWIAQKKVNGQEVCVYSIWDEGTLKGYSCYSPTYRAGMGSGIFFSPVEHQAIKNRVKRFGEAINYTGQLSFDVIISEDETWFIECNPRGTSGAHLLHSELNSCFLEKQEIASNQQDYFMLTFLMITTHPLAFFSKNVRRAKDVIFRWNDPLPACAQMLSVFELLYLKLAKGVSLLEATTFDIEWNGDEH